MSQSHTSKDRIWAAVSYLWVISIFVLLTTKNSFVKRHAKQGFLIFVGECVVFLPVLGFLFGWIISVLAFVFSIFGFIKALQGEEWMVPIIGKWWDEKIRI